MLLRHRVVLSGCRPAHLNTPSLPAWQVVEDFGLLSFHPLAIEDKESVAALVALVDKANGYVFAGLARKGAPAPPAGE